MKKLVLKVKGMTCKSCEMLITDELEERDGVQHIAVSQPKGEATLEYDPEKISEDTIKEIIRKEGFDV